MTFPSRHAAALGALGLLAIALAASVLVAKLHAHADVGRQAQLHIAHADRNLQRVDTQIALLLDPAEEDDKDRSAVREPLGRLMSGLARLERLDPGARTRRLHAAARRYERRVEQVLSAFPSRSQDAVSVAAAGADADAQSFRGLIQLTSSSYERGATKALDLANIGSTLILLLAVLLIVALSLWTGRWRRNAAVAVAEREAIRESEARFRALVENSTDLVTVVGPDLTIRYQSASVTSLLGHDPDALVGTSFARLVHPNDLSPALTLCTDRPGSAELRLATDDGAWLVCEARSNSHLDDPRIEGIVLNIRDVTERRSLEDRLRHQAFHDPLTDLPNRTAFQERVQAALDGSSPVTVLVLGVDDLKATNDAMNHDAGDRILATVAARLRAATRENDLVARMGGDEFAVLVGGLDPGNASSRAGDLLEAVSERCEVEGREVPVSATVGIASAEPGTVNADELIRNADIAMSRAKRRAKGTHATFEPGMDRDAQERLALKADLVRAIAAGEITLHYQPIVDVETLEVVSLEALARWNHPDRGLVAPGDFIPLAEETGVIVPLGAKVLETACRELLLHEAAAPALAGLSLNVNVSVRELREPAFVDGVRRIIRATALDPSRLVLEITESVIMTEREASLHAMRALRALGVRVAIDDFGTGYSSLAALQHLPVDIVKVDRAFTSELDEDRAAAELAHTVLGIGRALGRITVAEGVESAHQVRRLRELGCDLAQGFHFTRPLPFEELVCLVKEGSPWARGTPARLAPVGLEAIGGL